MSNLNTYKIGIDIGYSSTKISANGKLFKLPTAISFAIDSGINFGEDEFYLFEGKKYRVGDIAVDESMTTTDYQFIEKYAPLIVYHVLNKLDFINENGKLIHDIEIRTGLALVDIHNKDRFIQRLKNINVNNHKLIISNIKVTAQGAGVFYDYLNKNPEVPLTSSVIDIGYNTINYLYFEDNVPIKNKCKSFPGHGVVSIIRPFTNWLENTFQIQFTEQEAIKILMNKKFIFNGEDQSGVKKIIDDLKMNFITKLFNSILTSEKKLLSTSEKVIFAGGGTYFLDDIAFKQKNIVFAEKPYEFSNVRGYIL